MAKQGTKLLIAWVKKHMIAFYLGHFSVATPTKLLAALETSSLQRGETKAKSHFQKETSQNEVSYLTSGCIQLCSSRYLSTQPKVHD